TGANDYDISIDNTIAAIDPTNPTAAEIAAAINAGLVAAAAPATPEVNASVDGAGRIQLNVVAPGIQGQPVQIGLNTGSTYSLDALGFLPDNRIDSASPVIQANN